MEKTTKLSKLRVDSVKLPLGMDNPHPSFSWQMISDRTGAGQTGYRIRVTDGHESCWDSGRVDSGLSVGIRYPLDAAALKPETKYQWQLTVWDETDTALSAVSEFTTGLMCKSLSDWHGAQWIGPDEINLAAETVPVFQLRFKLQIAEGGSSAGVVFGAGDPRLNASTKNNYLICGENYIAYRINVSKIPAVVEVCRKGYAPGEEEEKQVAEIEIPVEVLNEENRYAQHSYEIVISGSQMEVMTVDGNSLETDEENNRLVQNHMHPVLEKTHLVLNPLRAVMDMPVYPRLCQIGFTTDENTEVLFVDYAVNHYGGEMNEVFGEKTGATYDIFAGKQGVSVHENRIFVTNGTLVYADPSHASVPMLRKEFNTRKKAASARVFAAAKGIYEMTINGKKVGNEYLAPGDMDFCQRILYKAYDVTDLIQEGDNAFGVVLASGWYGDQTSYTIEGYNYYGDRQAFLGVLTITYEDDTVEYIVTDDRWQYFGEGPVRYAGNFNGEIYDAAREAVIKGWNLPHFNADGWRAATIMDSSVNGYEPVITAKTDTGITRVETLNAVFVSAETRGSDQDTVYIYDMGVNMVGIPEITFPSGKAGQQVTIRYAEVLYPHLEKDNPFYYGELGGLILTENLRGALVTDRYTMKGEKNEVFKPLFTFHGYRYVEISGIDEKIPAENIKGIVLSSVRPASRYDSSNALANQLFTNIIRSTIGNHLSIPTDCPQRDERLGWAGDAQVFSETATYMSDMTGFYRNFAMLQRDAQGPDGTFNLFAPSLAKPGVAFALGYTWNAAGVVIPYQTYLQYGDMAVLEENYPAMKKHVEGMMGMKADGRNYLTSHIGFLGDHLAVVDTDASLMDNAQFYRVLRYVQKTAEILGKNKDAVFFGAYADGLRDEWNAVFVNKQHKTQNADGILQDTQASYALPLMCGVFSEENKVYACSMLSEACRKTGYTMTTGFMGTGPLLPALAEGGDLDGAYQMFEQTGYPSWLYPVVNGATSIWERWDSCTIENGFGGHNTMNSFNHYSLGAVGTWMMEYQAGIQRHETDGFKRFILQPMPGGHFTYVNASYDSIYGTVESGWTAKDGVLISYRAVVPANTAAALYLPVEQVEAERFGKIQGVCYVGMTKRYGVTAAEFELTSGSYLFNVK